MAGIILGLIFGAADFYFLDRFVSSVTKKQKPNVIYALLFLFTPFLFLLTVAFLIPISLLWTGTALVSMVIILSVIKFIIQTIKQRK